MAYFGRKLRYTIESQDPIKLGDGVNTYKTPFEIDKSECVSSLNTSSRVYPSLAVRPGSVSQYGTDVTPFVENAIGVRNGSIFNVQDGAVWKYWNGSSFQNLATGLTSSKGKIVELTNSSGTKYTVLFNGTDRKAWDGSTVTDLADAPQTNLVTVDDNRLYAVKDSILKYSAIYSVSDWTTFEDAGNIPVAGIIGTETALANFNDMVIVFSDQTMHILYGDDYTNFAFTDPIKVGCVSDRSIVEHNSVMYFMDYYRIMAFTGGLPVEISKKVRAYLRNINYTHMSKICSGKWDKYIYFSIPYGDSATDNNLTLEYDTENQTWYPMDVGFTNFVTIGQDLIGITVAGKAVKLNQGTADDSTAVVWEHTTGVWDWSAIRPRKADREYYLIIDLPIGSTLSLSYSETIDSDDFASLKSFTPNASEQNVQVKIPITVLKNYTWKRLKFSGTGPCTIHYIEEYKRTKMR